MIPFCLCYSEMIVDTRLKQITDLLKPEAIDRRAMIDHEIDNDRFIRNFIRRMESHCPDPKVLTDRLKRIEAVTQE
jgi:hypothetical protein